MVTHRAVHVGTAHGASRALSGMVSRLAYSVFTPDEGEAANSEPVEFETLVSTVTRLWANALRFTDHR